jgi:hypothetical protein
MLQVERIDMVFGPTPKFRQPCGGPSLASPMDRTRNARCSARERPAGREAGYQPMISDQGRTDVVGKSPIYPPKTPVERRQSVTSADYIAAAFVLVNGKSP